MATESGGAVATESGEAVATESGEAGTTGDEMVATAGDETAANGEVMYADVRHVEKMVGTTREAADGNRVRRRQDGDEIGGPRDETGDKTAGDERDDGDRWGNVYG